MAAKKCMHGAGQTLEGKNNQVQPFILQNMI